MRPRVHKDDLEEFLESLAQNASPGDRVPAIRDLMKTYEVSQVVVQRALQGLRAKGLIASEVGRGTFFVRHEPVVAAETSPGEARSPRSVLLLRRSAASVGRGRLLLEGLQRRFSEDGHRVIEVSYNDPEHARAVLLALPKFDACVVQSSFKPIAVDLLVALKEKTDVVAIDGAALTGTDVDSVGTEWGEPLEVAVSLLRRSRHTRIAFAVTSVPFLAAQVAKRRLESLQHKLPDMSLALITLPQLPFEHYEESLVEAIGRRLEDASQPPFTALVAWGVEDGAKFRLLLKERGLAVPAQLSVVLLGRTDCPNEHAGYFETIGCTVADQIDYLHGTVEARWSDPELPYALRFTPMARRKGASIKHPEPRLAGTKRTPRRPASGSRIK